MANWWDDPDIAAELAATPGVTFQTDEFGESTGMPLSGTPRHILEARTAPELGRTYTGAMSIGEEEDEFQAWKLRMGYGNLPDDTVPQGSIDEFGNRRGMTLWELFDSSLRIGRDNPFVQPSDGADDGSYPNPIATGDPGGTGAADDTVRRNMEDAFVAALQLAGLESDLIKTLWTWAEDKLVSDPSFTATRALLEMYDHEAFQARFPAIKAMHDAGVTRRDIPTPGQYIAYENEIVREMNRVGINADDVTVDTVVEDLLVGRVGIDEAISRLDEAKRMMYDVPEAVKEIFLAWAPTDSEGNTTYPESSLMLAFLDPDDKWSDIQEQIAAAETAGGAKLRAGLDISREMAERVANVSNDQAAIWNQFANLKQKEALFAETLTENIDLDMATHGVVGEFQLEGMGEGEDYMTGLELSDLITRRGQRRSAAFSGGGGAMLAGTTTGFGAANA
jgi:hypothetical protein